MSVTCTSIDLFRCGIRGGYMQMVGLDDQVMDQIYKHVSISLCPNTPGQVCACQMHGIFVAKSYARVLIIEYNVGGLKHVPCLHIANSRLTVCLHVACLLARGCELVIMVIGQDLKTGKRACTARTLYDTAKFKTGQQDVLNLDSAHCTQQVTQWITAKHVHVYGAGTCTDASACCCSNYCL